MCFADSFCKGSTALMRAACEGKTDVVTALLDSGASIEAKNNDVRLAFQSVLHRHNLCLFHACVFVCFLICARSLTPFLGLDGADVRSSERKDGRGDGAARPRRRHRGQE